MNQRPSLIKKMTTVIGVVFFVAVMMVCVGSFLMNKGLMTDNMTNQMQATAYYYEAQLENWIRVRSDQLDRLGEELLAIPQGERTESAVFEKVSFFTKRSTSYGVIADYLVTPDKKMISGDGHIPEPGYDPTKNSYYKDAVAKGGLVVSEPYMDVTTGGMIITLSKPLMDNGNLYGVVAVDIKIDAIKSIFDNYLTDDGSYIFLLDQAGHILSHTNDAYQPTSERMVLATETKNSDILLKSSPTPVLYKDYDDEDKFAMAIHEPNSNWIIGLVYPREIISAELFYQGMISFILFIIGLVVGLSIIIRMLRKSLAPIRGVVGAARQMIEGDLNIDVSVQTNDEIGELGTVFNETVQYLHDMIAELSDILNEMANGNLVVETKCTYYGDFDRIRVSIENIVQNMNEIIGGIGMAANQVAAGSAQVAHGAQHLAGGAMEQNEQVDDLISRISEVTSVTQSNAAECTNASKITADVAQKLQESNQYMHEMVEAMDHINGSSEEIGKIIKTIEDIAFQTNILALNAAVEAARAGTAGKGFAVVADEVRNLASKSAEAASHTTALIETSLAAVNEGTRIAHETEKSLQEVVNTANQVTTIIDDIVTLSGEQVAEIGRISDGVQKISCVVQSNSATAEQGAATSEELSGQAQTMNDLVGRFRTK